MGLISKPIFSRLAKRYDIRQAASESMESGQVLVPVTNADELLRIAKGSSTTAPNNTARTDTYTVPNNKKWILYWATCARANTGDNIIDLQISGSRYTITRNTASTLLNVALNQIPLSAGDSVIIEMQAGTSGALYSYVFYAEEDA